MKFQQDKKKFVE